MAGRLSYFYDKWLHVTNDSIILSWVRGYKIPFVKKPIQKQDVCLQPYNNLNIKAINKCIHNLLECGYISICTPQKGQFLSPVFTVPKPNGKHRFILNLKKLNKFVKLDHFKMEDYRTAIKLLNKNYYMATIDLKDAYCLISIDVEFRKKLRFKWNSSEFNNVIFEFNVLPFGLSTSPFVFTKLLKPVLKLLRSQGYLSVNYLDDFLCIGRTYYECLQNVNATVKLLSQLGFVLNREKSNLKPDKKCKFLGFLLDTENMILFLPDDKKSKIKNKINEFLIRTTCTIRQFARFLGLLTSACPAVRYGWVYTKLFEREKFLALAKNHDNFDKEMLITHTVRPDLLWWRDHIDTAYAPFHNNNYVIELFSDASLTGWGASCNSNTANGYWKLSQQSLHINTLELIAAFYALKIFATDLHDCDILIRVDNTTAIAYINRMGGIQHPHLNALSRQIWQWCECRNIFLFASYIKSADNKEADRASRQINVDTEWELADYAFDKLVNNFGTPQFDLFASSYNYKCERYASWKLDPHSEVIDSFTFDWFKLSFYAFPPFCLITKVLQKIVKDKAEGILVVPNWRSQAWYPLWIQLKISEEIVFCPDKNLLKSPFRDAHPLHADLTLVAAKVSGKL